VEKDGRWAVLASGGVASAEGYVRLPLQQWNSPITTWGRGEQSIMYQTRGHTHVHTYISRYPTAYAQHFWRTGLALCAPCSTATLPPFSSAPLAREETLPVTSAPRAAHLPNCLFRCMRVGSGERMRVSRIAARATDSPSLTAPPRAPFRFSARPSARRCGACAEPRLGSRAACCHGARLAPRR